MKVEGSRAIFRVLVALALAATLLAALSSCSDAGPKRQALEASAVEKTPFYTDDAKRVLGSQTLVKGMETFYERTGVQPYLYVLADGTATASSDLSRRAQELYGELFIDEGHLLLVYCDDGRGSYNFAIFVGASARTVMDDAALEILSEQVDKQMEMSSYLRCKERAFSNAFEDAAERIMTESLPIGSESEAPSELGDQPSASPSSAGSVLGTIGFVLLLALGAVIVLFVIAVIYGGHLQKEKRIQEIIDSPPEKLGDQELEELAKKYEAKQEDADAQPPVR